MIDVLNKGYRDMYKNRGLSDDKAPIFTSVVPTNVYGAYDNFNLKGDSGTVLFSS